LGRFSGTMSETKMSTYRQFAHLPPSTCTSPPSASSPCAPARRRCRRRASAPLSRNSMRKSKIALYLLRSRPRCAPWLADPDDLPHRRPRHERRASPPLRRLRSRRTMKHVGLSNRAWRALQAKSTGALMKRAALRPCARLRAQTAPYWNRSREDWSASRV